MALSGDKDGDKEGANSGACRGLFTGGNPNRGCET